MAARGDNNNINRQQEEDRRRSSNINRNFPKTQQRFVPKSQNQKTLSNSLRQSLQDYNKSDASASSSAGDGAAASSGSVRMGSSGEWVSTRAVAAAGHSGGRFVNYLPQDEAVAAGLRAEEGGLDPVESQRVVDLLNRELSRLLKLSPRDFWREVASDNSLHEFLDSFLKFRSRWYDFPHRGAKGTVAGVIVGENELSRRVFMVLYRISSNRDPGALAADTLSSKDHAFLLQEKKLLDLPKLLDICAIYGHENEDLTRSLVENALKAQLKIHDYLTAVTSHFLDIVHTMHQRCVSSVEALFSSKDSEDHGSKLLYTDFLEVMDFINDAIVSMDAFINAYKLAAVFFSCPVELSYGNEELLTNLTKLHDTLLPSLHQGFQINLMGGNDGMLSNIAVSLKMLSLRMVNFGWKVLDFCYLTDEVFKDRLSISTVTKMFPAKVEDPVIRADILIQTFREMNAVPYAGENHGRTFLQNLEKSYHVMNKVQSLQKGGWIFMDDGQLQYLSGIMMSSLPSNIKESPVVSTPVPSNEVEMNEHAAIIESKISQIKDLFPDYGKGFLAGCLEVYNNNPEEVIQRILEGTLHEDLKCLDTSLETKPLPKSTSTVNRKDKGKGKLVESTPLSLTTPLLSADTIAAGDAQPKGHSVSSSSSVGWFVRKPNNMPDHYAPEPRDEKNVARTVALISQYEYEDEYDDSFDDLGLSVAESGGEEGEILTDRISSNSGKSSGIESENSARPTSASKWGSRKQPQFYVKDGKNYSYKVAGSIAVANSNEASLVSQAQAELIYGLGRGGNIPLGPVKKLAEYQGQDNESDEAENEGEESTRDQRGRGRGRERGRGRRGGRGGKLKESHEEQVNQSDVSEVEGRGNAGNQRGRGRRGRGSSHFRKDRAMSKHLSGVSGF